MISLLPRPYKFSEAQLVFSEMIDQLVMDLIERRTRTKELSFWVSFDPISLEELPSYDGPVSLDYYGRLHPGHVVGIVRMRAHTSSGKEIRSALLYAFDKKVDTRLYGNIIFGDRPVHDGDLFSRRHPKMSRLNRAKIFAPFAALVGFDEAVRAKEIHYVPKHILDPEEEIALNNMLNALHMATRTGMLARFNRVCVRVEYFEVCSDINNDAYGRLGLYHTETGVLWKVDPIGQIITVGGRNIPFDTISTLSIVRRST